VRNFQFLSFLSSNSVNNVCKLLQRLGDETPPRLRPLDPTSGLPSTDPSTIAMKIPGAASPCKSAEIGSCPIIFLWLWPTTDNEPHGRHVPANKIWMRTETTVLLCMLCWNYSTKQMMKQSYGWNQPRPQHSRK